MSWPPAATATPRPHPKKKAACDHPGHRTLAGTPAHAHHHHHHRNPKENLMKRSLISLPDDLYSKLKTAAAAERRSVHNEILCLLERGLAEQNSQPAAIVAPDPSRPGRPVLVITELSDLRGPAGGKIVLPSRLYPDPAGTVFDLDQPWGLNEACQVVLTEAVGAWDLAAWLNAARLIEAWPRLYLPAAVRQAWEQAHPVLAAAAQPGT
jgi:plasmid stability protein